MIKTRILNWNYPKDVSKGHAKADKIKLCQKNQIMVIERCEAFSDFKPGSIPTQTNNMPK